MSDEAYTEAIDEIERLNQLNDDLISDKDRIAEIAKKGLAEKDAEIERLRNEIVVLQRNELYMEGLLFRAADALEHVLPIKTYAFIAHYPYYDLKNELREAAS
jgi:hypothetical protein